MTKVIDLEQERLEREHAAGHEAHERGEAFAVEDFEFTDDMGWIDGERPVLLLTKPDELRGIRMTVDDARKLGEALLEMVKEGPPEEGDET